MINTFSNLETFASKWLYIIDKDNNKVRLHFNTIQKAIDNNTRGRDIILKPRQKGVSTYFQAKHTWLAITRSVTTATLAHDDNTTQRLRRMTDRYYNGIVNTIYEHAGVNPDKLSSEEKKLLPIPQRKYSNAKVSTFPDFDSEAIIVTAGSGDTGIGFTFSHVHGSEVAKWKEATNIMSGLMQGVPKSGQIALESTPNGAQGYYYEKVMEVLNQESDWQNILKRQTWVDGLDWRLHFFTWWYDDEYQLPLVEGEVIEYTGHSPMGMKSELELVDKFNLTPEQIKWRRAKIRDLKHEFIQEYPEDVIDCFLLSGIGYFGDIRNCIRSGVYSISSTPIEGNRYYAGLDFGQSNDFTVLSVIDKDTKQQVDMLRINHMTWGEMRSQIKAMCDKWAIKYILAEANSIGSVNIEQLKKEFSESKVKTKILEFTTSNSSKAEIMSNLHEALHEVGLKLLDDEIQTHEIQAYTRTYTSAGTPILNAPGDEHDDTVIALALAWHCAMYFGRKLIH